MKGRKCQKVPLAVAAGMGLPIPRSIFFLPHSLKGVIKDLPLPPALTQTPLETEVTMA